MKRHLVVTTAMAAVLAALTFGADAQVRSELGRSEFQNHCAICHGASGRGDGEYARLLNVKTPDLTTVARRNGGVFPVDQMHALIDGRTMPAGHGTRQMPIWGVAYGVNAVEQARGAPMHDPEIFVRVRILSLIDYLYTLQGQ